MLIWALRMNIFELSFSLLAVLLTYLLGGYLFRYIGWWGVVPAAILGFGIVAAFVIVARKFAQRHHRTTREK